MTHIVNHTTASRFRRGRRAGTAGAALRLRRFGLLLGVVLPLLLAACSGSKALTRLRIERVEEFRPQRTGFGFAEGTVAVSLYNGNKKNVIFDSGRIDLKLNGRTIGSAMLTRSTVVGSGMQRVEVPVRVRFAVEGIGSWLKILSPGQERRTRRPTLRITGSLNIVAGSPLRSQTVRFDRRLDRKAAEWLGRISYKSY